jgi:DNA topoisomerase-1
MPVETSPVQTAREAGLRYVSDRMPGIRRVRRGKHFSYVAADGTPIRDEAELQRIRSLAVPPAYEDVWISPHPLGHLQATGIDARGRKQYRYHPKWREVRDETKYHRMLAFAKALPRIRETVSAQLKLPGLTRERVLAAIVRLLEETTIRVGNEEYAQENDSYGLTTLRNKHADVKGERIRFQFKGKSGVKHAIQLRDRALAKVIRACQELPGQGLFEYVDDEGGVHTIDSADVNQFIKTISGGDFTAKDFRTWVGTVQCALLLAEREPASTQSDRKRALNDVIAAVAKRLGNTPAVCRKSYIHPEVLACYTEEGSLGQKIRGKPAKGLLPEERFVVAFLRRRERETPQQRTTKKLRESLRRQGRNERSKRSAC